MSTSINSSGITFPDSTTQTTAANGTLTFNTVGSYTWATVQTMTEYQGGTTFASSSIASCCVAWMGSGNLPIDFYTWGYNLSGTWRLMSFSRSYYSGYPATLYIRIS